MYTHAEYITRARATEKYGFVVATRKSLQRKQVFCITRVKSTTANAGR